MILFFSVLTKSLDDQTPKPRDSIDWPKINGIHIITISSCRKIYILQPILKRIISQMEQIVADLTI